MIGFRHALLLLLPIVLLDVLAIPSSALAAIYTANPANYRTVLKDLKPGDHLRLIPGRYHDGLPIHFLSGTAGMRIMISGPEDGLRAVLVARSGHNTISIVNSSYITIRNLDLDGSGLAVDGVKCEGHADWSHHITLEKLNIRGHGNDQQIVGISTKCPAWNWVIRNNVIRDAGTGIYLGNSDGHAPFIAGLIEHNLITDTIGYNLQIKHQQFRPRIGGMPQQRSTTVIRHNVFSKTNGASMAMARPNLLIGHWPLAGPGSSDHYLIYGNFFYQNRSESLFQGEGNIALYNNLFMNHFGDAIRIQPHNGTLRMISIFYNTVIARDSGIVIAPQGRDRAYRQFVADNIVFARAPLSGGPPDDNVIGEYFEAGVYLTRPFALLGEMNLMPLKSANLKKSGDNAAFDIYPHANLDFDGSPRGNLDAGAYTFEKERPRWLPALEIKPAPPTQ